MRSRIRPSRNRAKKLFATTIFLSAFLLFSVQPMMGKFLLPWFGGTSSVWTTCMLFFQAALLGGYAYAHALQRLRVRLQVVCHCVLLASSVALLGVCMAVWGLPLLPPASWRPLAGDDPLFHLGKVLAAGIGLHFFVLSATSPLLQRWFGSVSAGSPYRLYAVSNAGSLLGLLCYPFLVEPAMVLSAQARSWAAVFGVFVAGCVGCGALAFRGGRGQDRAVDAAEGRETEGMALSPARRRIRGILWLLLPLCSSAMLLAVTNNMCQEIAAVPFLWVLPLALYLLSFILCFEGRRWYVRRIYVAVVAVATFVVLVTALLGVRLRIPVHVVSYSIFLFAFCMTCHGELARLKPEASGLTRFYLAIAAGGCAGGVFVGIGAPLLFAGFWEFHVTLLAGWLALAAVFALDRKSFFYAGDRVHAFLLVLLAAYLAARPLVLKTGLRDLGASVAGLTMLHVLLTFLIAGIAWMLVRRWRMAASPVTSRIMAGTVIFFAECFLIFEVRSERKVTLDAARNFYGVVRVQKLTARDGTPYLQLTHGQIVHGFQYLVEPLRRQPAGYFVPGSGVGLALTHHPRRAPNGGAAQPLRIGVTGLGAGSLAAYAHKGDAIRFYEINPVVNACAAGPDARFSYVRDCPGEVSVIMGDARLSMERELEEGKPQSLDVLILDAFSSDSVPVHLLTEEAFRMYLRHLRDDDAILAVNISNRFLDLRPLLRTVSEHFGLAARCFEFAGNPPVPSASRWVLLCRNPAFFESEEIRSKSVPWGEGKDILWTDSFSNMLGLLR
jgi:hypothetical protein